MIPRREPENHCYIDFEDMDVFTDEFKAIILKCMDCAGVTKDTAFVAGCAWYTPHFVRAVEDVDGLSTIDVSPGFVMWEGYTPASYSGIRVFKKNNPFKDIDPSNFTISFFFKDYPI